MPETLPTIGDFRGTPDTSPRKEVPEVKAVPMPADPDTRSAESVVATTVEDLKAAQAAEAALTPVERYQKRLREAGIAMSAATGIYDAVMTKGFYEEYVSLGRGHKATFKTRAYEDALRLQTALEMQKPQLVITQDELVTRFNMAASLSEWQGKALPHETDADFEAALKLIRKLPGPVYSMLATELVKFDQKVMTVFSEGAAENFS